MGTTNDDVELHTWGGYHWAHFVPGVRIAVFLEGHDRQGEPADARAQLEHEPPEKIAAFVKLLGREALRHVGERTKL